jgi:hypothetical protein
LTHKTKARNVLQTALQLSDQRWLKFLHFIKMYLAMEEWFHDCNDKNEVNVSKGEISKVLSALQIFSQDQITQMVTVYQKCMA